MYLFLCKRVYMRNIELRNSSSLLWSKVRRCDYIYMHEREKKTSPRTWSSMFSPYPHFPSRLAPLGQGKLLQQLRGLS